MNRVQPYSVGFVLAWLAAAGHACWVLLVWLGGAQAVMDFVFRLHMIAPVYRVEPFQFGTAIGLIAFTAAIGFLLGSFGGLLWNGFGPPSHKTSAPAPKPHLM